ncbi:hypothetical protein MNBD_CHLOROFLEXI01-4000 [hydrothermal vent metagenome]|uniref:Gamma-glutamylcyclotransferase AIG2-like domain-containing protein n=1 Tax=hydrothermal vent metagenome TaxID=652676 RepID=A0A3B0VL15_9ZZZZ
MSKAEQTPFFVYGTLLPNQPNFPIWGSAILNMEAAQFHGGRLHDMGFYPMVIAAKAATVQGMVIMVAAASYRTIQQQLDVLEGYDPANQAGSAYRRQRAQVVMANGRFQPAWIYRGQPQFVKDKPIVANGDWTTYAASKQAESEAWWRNINSVAGLDK